MNTIKQLALAIVLTLKRLGEEVRGWLSRGWPYLLAGFLFGACATAIGGSLADDRPSLRIVNHSWQDVRVYLRQTPLAMPVRVMTVGSVETQTKTLRQQIGLSTQIVVVTFPGNERWESPPLFGTSGCFELIVRNHLPLNLLTPC